MSKALQILENLALIGSVLGPAFVKSPHGQAILTASNQLLLAEIELANSQKQASAPTVAPQAA